METLTDDMIDSLLNEAFANGDDQMVATCDKAIEGEKAARQQVCDAINDARAMDEDAEYVPVVV